ncbi:MAG: transporter substrate-binding domain-containing protein, partial [Clostridiales bacterium]|nr:transporter substrate-binding domain-containing protein [Clostridiales bacterium]
MQNTSKHKKQFCARGEGTVYTAVRSRCIACVKIVSALAVCLILLLSCLIPSALTTAFAMGERINSKTYKAGVFEFDGYHNMDPESKRLTGYGIEFLNLVSEYSHLNFIYTGFDKSWSDMQTMLEEGEIDVVTSARRTPDREAKFDFSQPIGRNKTVLSIQVNNKKMHRGDYKSYNGMIVGLVTGSTQNQSLVEFAADKGFTYTTREFEDTTALANALQEGKIDAILSSNLRKATDEKELDVIEEADFYAIVRKGDTELLEEINYAIEQMDLNEGDWKNVLFYKYYGADYSSGLSFTENEQEYIRQVQSGEKTIKVTALGGRAPYSYVEDGKLDGIMPAYFGRLMRIAELPYELVAPQDSDDYNRMLEDQTVNVVIDRIGIDDITADSNGRGFHTNTYMTASIARVIRKDVNVKDIEVVAVCASQGKDLIKQDLLEGHEIMDCATSEEAVSAVLNGDADAAYVYAYTAQLFVNRDKSNTLAYNMMEGMSANFSMHVSANTDHELITILNKCIKQVPDDTLNRLALEYISEDLGFLDYIQSNPEILIIVGLLLVLIAGIIVALYLRGRWSKKMLQTTEQTNRKMGEQLAIVGALSRDYTNVYAVNEELGTARIIKLEGYVTDGLKKDSSDGYDYTTLLEKYIPNRVHPEDQEELRKALALDNVREKLKEENSYVGTYRVVENGEIHHFQYTYLKIADRNKEHDDFILVGFRNIDEVIRKEQEQKDVLAEALAQAQYANKAKTTFLNNMSHDIRTPMNAIIGFTSLAVTHIDNKDQIKDYLGKIMTSGNHLLSLINDVLDMSRIESGKVKIEEKETSLPEVMHDLKTIVQADVKSKQLEFYIDTLDVTNETIICDKLRLNQVLLNILSNAMKYTKPGGMVSVRVIQTAEAQDGYASYEFRVKDTGIGMSPEFLKHVFEPFEREQTSTVSGIQGTGLGLAITNNIVYMMNGTITVESEIGKGSEFIVNFRFRVADAPVETQRLEQLANLRALVVDDDVNTCISVSKMLSTIGMRPDWTTLGNEAVIRTQFALEQNEAYSAYIIDWLMPDMNGIELVRRIRKIIGDMTPVIILTAYDWSDIEKEAREAGVTAFCSKPLFLSELRSVLAAPYATPKSAQEEEKPEMHFDGKKLLLVEDNELNQEIAQSILEDAGFVIDTADDGSIAVERMKEKPAGTYDLILMDVQMPIMNGYEATK